MISQKKNSKKLKKKKRKYCSSKFFKANNELHIFKKLTEIKNQKFDPWVSLFIISRWLCQANVFALVQHVVPLFCRWTLAQLAAWTGNMG
jgi:hypothetical protein